MRPHTQKGVVMKRHMYQYLSLGMLFGCALTHAQATEGTNSSPVVSQFYIRSQGANAVRRDISSVGKINLYDADKMYWTASLTPEYTRSFDDKEINRALFGDALCDGRILQIEGSQAANREENALLADYFYLPTDFKSNVLVEPRIQSLLVDLNFHVGLDNILTGLYFWVQAPLVWTKWNLNVHETISNPGVNAYAEGYFTPNALPRNQLLNGFLDYAAGKAPGTPGTTANTVSQFVSFQGDTETVNTLFTPLKCARFCTDDDELTRIAEVRFALGWNALLDEDYHLGFNIQASAPTGNRVKSDGLFSVQNGNGKHWELGAGMTAHYTFWRSQDDQKQIGFYADLNVTHLFTARQTRCFDLCGLPLSKYMLAAQMEPANSSFNLKGGGTAATYQFANTFAPVANITSTDVNISVGAQADLVFWLNYTCGGWNVDAGYNLWARSCEKIKLLDECDQCSTFPENTWVLKGDEQVYGFMSANDTGGTLLLGDPVELSASQSNATINGGTNFGTAGPPTPAQIATAITNPNIDAPQLATAGVSNVALNASRTSVSQINTSIQPIFITQENINYARAKGLSNKLFYNVTYTWLDGNDWTPYVGWGGEIEWGSGHGKSCNDCDNSCESDCSKNECESSCDSDCDDSNSTNGSCTRVALSQWGLWAKFGVSYN